MAWRLRSRRSRILLGLVIAVLVMVVFVSATTRFERFAGSGLRPTWAEPCRDDSPRHDRVLLADCARSTGYVAWVRDEHPPGHTRDVHFAVVGRFGVIIVKLDDPNVIPIPRLSSRVTVVGPLVRARNGMREIQVWRLES